MLNSLENCPCGRKHEVNIKAVEIGSGLLEKTAEILKKNGFPTKILVSADKNTLAASNGILDILKSGGFDCTLRMYDGSTTDEMTEVNTITDLCKDVGGILSVGSGMLNDICRLAALRADKEFAIFATAPSMDGFASGSSTFNQNNFKVTYAGRQPSIIIGDTAILAASPVVLKAAGFGDMIAKYISIVDWKVSNLVTGEYYCEKIADITRTALNKVVSMADRVTQNDEETAGAIMEALVLAGLAMKLGDSVRPAAGTEHILTFFWEIMKLQKGEPAGLHGKKVGVATLYATKIYKILASCENMTFREENPDWEKIYNVYGPNLKEYIKNLNSPTITEETSVQILADNWPRIRRIVNEELPSYEELYSIMKKAGAATTFEEIAVSDELAAIGFEYHPYMRHRMTLMRLIPMLDVDFKAIISEDIIKSGNFISAKCGT